jgi:folate-binding protein YgfZ
MYKIEYYAVLTVEGEKSFDFLQGQLTCDLRLLDNQNNIRGAMCNLKGRIIAMMDILKIEHGYQLIIHQEVIDDVMKKWLKVALLSRVKLTKHINPVYMDYEQDKLIISLEQTNVINDTQEWDYIALSHHRFDIIKKTQELFLPHDLSLQLTDILSFNKGCYKGQEIVARMHYKAVLKYHLVQLSLPIDSHLLPGETIEENQATIVSCAKKDSQHLSVLATQKICL